MLFKIDPAKHEHEIDCFKKVISSTHPSVVSEIGVAVHFAFWAQKIVQQKSMNFF